MPLLERAPSECFLAIRHMKSSFRRVAWAFQLNDGVASRRSDIVSRSIAVASASIGAACESVGTPWAAVGAHSALVRRLPRQHRSRLREPSSGRGSNNDAHRRIDADSASIGIASRVGGSISRNNDGANRRVGIVSLSIRIASRRDGTALCIVGAASRTRFTLSRCVGSVVPCASNV